MNIETKIIENKVKEIIETLAINPGEEVLEKTPARVAKALLEVTSGYRVNIDEIFNNAFFKVNYKEMVVVKDIEFYSLCEHHLLPFFGKVHVAYVPSGKIVGLSKIPRLVEAYSKRLQIQERLTTQIAETLNEKLKPKGVAVVIKAQHMCMTMRGAKSRNSIAVTSSMLGCFEKDSKIRNEFLNLIG